MQTTIRKAKKEDVARIKKLDYFDEILKKCSPLDKLDTKYKPKKGEKDYYEKFVSGRNKWCYVAEDRKKLVGFVTFNLEKRDLWWKVKKVGYIDLIVIDKKYCGKGISKLSLNKVYQIFKEKKLDYIKLSVQKDNPKAHKIWTKQGFKDFKIDMYKKI